MSAHVLLNVLNELVKRYKMLDFQSIYRLFATCLVNSVMQEHEY